MKPTIQLINALRKASDRIGVDPYYDWSSCVRCNCGTLAQEVIGVDADRLREMMGDRMGPWTWDANRCEKTGIPVDVVFVLLARAGMEYGDYFEIEYLRNQSICDRAGLTDFVGHYKNPQFVARYFRAQADILEEQLGEQFETRPLTPSPVGLEVGR